MRTFSLIQPFVLCFVLLGCASFGGPKSPPPHTAKTLEEMNRRLEQVEGNRQLDEYEQSQQIAAVQEEVDERDKTLREEIRGVLARQKDELLDAAGQIALNRAAELVNARLAERGLTQYEVTPEQLGRLLKDPPDEPPTIGDVAKNVAKGAAGGAAKGVIGGGPGVGVGVAYGGGAALIGSLASIGAYWLRGRRNKEDLRNVAEAVASATTKTHGKDPS